MTQDAILERAFDLSHLPGGEDVLRGIPSAAHPVIVSACFDILAANPSAKRGDHPRLANRVWESVRALTFEGQGGRTRYVDEALSAPHLPGPVAVLENVLLVLLDAGDLEKTLMRQRDAIDAQLARLRVKRG
jgi:hypothetical protein